MITHFKIEHLCQNVSPIKPVFQTRTVIPTQLSKFLGSSVSFAEGGELTKKQLEKQTCLDSRPMDVAFDLLTSATKFPYPMCKRKTRAIECTIEN